MDFINKVTNKIARKLILLAHALLASATRPSPRCHNRLNTKLTTSAFSSIPFADPTEKEPIEHPAHHGASLEHHDPPSGMLARMFSPETTKQIQSQGNNGSGMDALNNKTIKQQERVAERSRLQRDGLFVPHMVRRLRSLAGPPAAHRC